MSSANTASKKPRRRRSAGTKGRSPKRTGDVSSKPRTALTAAEKPPRELTGAAIRRLRALGHHLDPVVQVGKDGVTDGVVAAIRAALLAHELVKVKVLAEAPVERHEAAAELAKRTSAKLAQVLGRTLLLYKRHPQKPKIEV